MAAAKENSKENLKDTFDPIWSFIEGKLNESVPHYIKYVLSYCGYNNGITIASIEDDDINYCVKEVRNGNVTSHYESKLGNKDALEGCTKSWQNFEFSRGHLNFLMDIVAMLKKYIEDNGVDCFKVGPVKASKKAVARKAHDKKSTAPKKKMKRSTLTTNSSLMLETYHKQQPSKVNDAETLMDKHMRILVKKMLGSLRTHTPELYLQIAHNINNKISELIMVKEANIKKLCESKSSHESESEMTEIKSENKSEELTDENSGYNEKHSEELNGKNSEELAVEDSKKYTASMLCPYCWKTINVFFVLTSGSPRWNSSNFDRHLKLTHRTQNSGSEDDCGDNNDEEARGSNKNQIAIISDTENQDVRRGSKSKYARDCITRDGKVNVVEIIDNDTKNDSQDPHVVKIQDERSDNKTQVARVGNKGRDANILTNIENAQLASSGTNNQDIRGGKLTEDARDNEIRDSAIIEILDDDSKDTHVVNKVQAARDGSKTRVANFGNYTRGGANIQHARICNKGQDANILANIDNAQVADSGTKNQDIRGGKKAEDARDNEIRDSVIIEILDDGSKDAGVVNKVQDARDGSKTRVANFRNCTRGVTNIQHAHVCSKGEDANIGNETEYGRAENYVRGGDIRYSECDGDGDSDMEIMNISEKPTMTAQNLNCPQTSQKFLFKNKCIVDYSESEESDADKEDKKEPITKSITNKASQPKMVCKKVLKNISNVNGSLIGTDWKVERERNWKKYF